MSSDGSRGSSDGIVFLGTDDAAAACLRVLHASVPVLLCVTPPAARRSRNAAAEPCPASAAARDLGIPVLETADVNGEASVAALRNAGARLAVVVSFGQILRKAVRESTPLGGLNLHYSLLPRWRGAAPVQRAIEAGDTVTGACVQRVVASLDAGDVLATVPVPIDPADDTASLRAKLTAVGAPLLAAVARSVLDGSAPAGIPQDASAVTWARPVDRSEGDVDPVRDGAARIALRIRAFEPWPRCRVRSVPGARGVGVPAPAAEVLTLRAATAEPGEPGDTPGVLVAADARGLLLATAEGRLRITRLQRPGGKDLDARSFLNGVRLLAGDRMERVPVART